MKIKETVFTGALSDQARYGEPQTTFYDVWPVKDVKNEQNEQKYEIRSVKYDENFIKSTVSDWSEYKSGYINGLELEPNHKIRVRCKEYMKDGQVVKLAKDMIVSTEIVDQNL